MSGFAGLKGAEAQSAHEQGRQAHDEEKTKLRDAAREANRIHCKQTRDRRREREHDLGQVRRVFTRAITQQRRWCRVVRAQLGVGLEQARSNCFLGVKFVTVRASARRQVGRQG